jgi:hypothetical protein
MKRIRGIVVAALLAVWCFPAIGSARSLPPEPAPPALSVPNGAAAAATAPGGADAASLAAREHQAPDLQDFKGGGVSIYIGSGALLVIVIVLLIILI